MHLQGNADACLGSWWGVMQRDSEPEVLVTPSLPHIRDCYHLHARVTLRAAPSALLGLGQGRAHAHLPAEEHTADTNSHSPQWSANASSSPSPPPQLFYPWGTSSSEIVMHLKSKFLAASSPEGWSLLGGDMLMVPSVRPAKQISKSSSIVIPAEVHFPTPTSPLCLWEVFQL